MKSADERGMKSFEKKHLKKMSCPSCGRAKEGGTGPQRDIRCDACKAEFLENNEALQAQWQQLLAEQTPPPVTGQRY
jgi:ribosomal protein L37AE/L43A